MKKLLSAGLTIFITICLILAWGASCAPAQKPVDPPPTLGEFAEVKSGFDAIDAKDISKVISFLASEECQGRLVGTKGSYLAGEFLAKKLKEYGLKPWGKDFYQEFLLEKKTFIPEGTYFKLINEKTGQAHKYQLEVDFYPTWHFSKAKAKGQIVFAGYGITAPEFNYDDYAGIDVKDKIVIVMWGEPKENEDTPFFDGKIPTKHSFLKEKIKNAQRQGAIGLIIPVFKPYAYLENTFYDLVDEIRIASIFAGAHVAKKFLENTSYSSYWEIRRKIDETLSPITFEIPDKIAEFGIAIELEKVVGRNIIGKLEGKDLSKEYIIICAHYDHVGIQRERIGLGKAYLGAWKIHPGADDNASGTAAVLEIAEAFSILKKNGKIPKRSIIFAFFDAEEWWMLGSEYFVRNLPMPLENIVTVINLDMVGRGKPEELQIIGSVMIEDFPKRSPHLYQALMKANEIVKLTLVYPQAWAETHGTFKFFLSDQATFYFASPREKRIPVLFLHTGLHEDYHKPSDTADKIDNVKVEKISKLTFLMTWQISNLAERPDYLEE